MFANAVYYPNYRVYRGDTPANLNYNCISHVFYAFAHVNSDGFVFFSDEWADLQLEVDGFKGCLGSFIALKQQKPHLKVILSIGGAGASENFAAVARSAAKRDNFGRSAFSIVRDAGLDGIDIDWEHPSDAQQGMDFLSLLATIRLYLPDDEYLLTAALPGGQWALQHIDLFKAQDYLDLIMLMTYDFTGPWVPTAGHHAQLHPGAPGEISGAAAIEYVLSTGFPSKKILLGVPVYGRSFLGALGPGDAYTGHAGEEGTFEYKSLPLPGTQEVVDHTRVAASCVGGDGGFVTYDNPETVKVKGQYCRSQQLGGMFYWTGTADISKGPRSLIETGFRALHTG
jgi:chitinase